MCASVKKFMVSVRECRQKTEDAFSQRDVAKGVKLSQRRPLKTVAFFSRTGRIHDDVRFNSNDTSRTSNAVQSRISICFYKGPLSSK